MDTSENRLIVRRRRRTHSAEFKGTVVAACRKPGVSIAAVALANGLDWPLASAAESAGWLRELLR